MRDSVGVSVSFGKYENDALCWEKWSTFSPNKYLEEVGKCSTPGSVAQKKAFFEAHYKKIAAIKAQADLLDHSTSDEDCTIHGSGELQDESFQMQVLDSQSPIVTVNSKLEEAVLVNDKSMKQVPITVNSNADKLEEAVLVNDESMKLVKQHFQVDLDPPEIRQEEKPQNVAPKINPNKVEKNSIEMKKKPASLTPKSPETPANKLSKPKTTSTSSLKKASAPSSSLRNKNQSVSESRRVAPVSLHLSINMSSDTASSSRRRSLFMEQMGDKDIVKRAFKTFQNRVNQLPSSDSGLKQLPTKRSEHKTCSTSMGYQKENERSKKAVEKMSPARRPTAAALKRSEVSLKSKEVKDADMKKKLNFKAKPLPSFYVLK